MTAKKQTAETGPLVGEYMKTEVVSVKPEATVRELVELFKETGVAGCPVVDETGGVVGMVTEGDVVAQDADLHFPRYFEFLDSLIYLESPKKFEERLRKITGATVGDIMTRDVITVSPQSSVHAAATIMADNRINRIPVVEKGKLVGIIGRHEVLRAMGL